LPALRSISGLRVDALHILGGAVLALFSIQLCIAYFLPVYTDEIGFKWDYARAFLDDGKIQLLTISCRTDPTAPWPALWIPARGLDALLYQDLSNPSKLRIMGFAYAGVFLIALHFLVRRACSAFEGASCWHVYTLALSFCTLGVLPFLLVMNRPELELMAGIAVLVVLVLPGRREVDSWRIAAAVAVLQYYLFSRHPKSLLLLPLFLACWYALRTHRGIRILGTVGTAALAVSLLRFYSRQLQCPLDNYVRSITASNVLSPDQLLQNPQYFFWRGFENLLGSAQYITNITFRTEYLSSWLPGDGSRTAGLAIAGNLGIEILWFVLLAVGIVGILLLLTQNLFGGSTGPPRSDPATRAVFVGLAASLVLTCFVQTQRNDYRSTQILLMILLCALLALAAAFQPFKRSLWRAAATAAFGACLISQAVFVHSFAGYPLASWGTPGPTIGQPFSVSHVGYASFRSKVVDLARECGISESQPPEHLVLDDSTYPAFWRAKLPYHLVYVTGSWATAIPDLEALLVARRYGGIVSECGRLPGSLRVRTKEKDRICCLVPDG